MRTSDSQESAPVLFSIEGDTVFTNEFIYVYTKNNQNNDSAFTRHDVKEYLRLYENFKLKVYEGRKRGIDTTDAYISEMMAYEEQLKKPYLTETEVTDQLLHEAYDRFSQEIRASHILVSIPDNSSPEDTLKAYKKISQIRKMAIDGSPFDSLAAKYSDDPSGKKNGGDLQYFTSLQMVYPFESAAYNTPVDSISPIVRSQFGYHIIKVVDKRKANNQVEVSHIMIRHDVSGEETARNGIFEIFDQANGGVDWNQLVNQYSEDQNSKGLGGRLQPFSLRRMPFEFQEAAFALQPGEISDPVRTDFGWHIIRMEKRFPAAEFTDMESAIRNRIERDVRADMGHEALISRLTEEWNAQMLVSPDAPVNQQDTLDLFVIGDSTYTTTGYNQFAEERGLQKGEAKNRLVREYFDHSVIAYEEEHLEEKYEDYKMLRREYREGILLFQLMDSEIWSRAANDSVGLKNFYDAHKENYLKPGKIRGTLYKLNGSENRDSLYSYVSNNAEGVLEDLILQYEQRKIVTPVAVNATPEELGINDKHNFTSGEILMTDAGFLKVYEMEDAEAAAFNQVQGKVIADYQEFLENEWIQQLRSDYNVILNENGLEYVYQQLVR